MTLVAAILALLIGLVSMFSLVPRIRLVEAVSLFATAFAAGAGFTHALVAMRTSAVAAPPRARR